MKRVVPLLLLVISLGCTAPGEREALRPLPEKAMVFVYQDMFTRARHQTTAALEAFYAENWLELEQTAQVLEQTARILPKSTEAPKNVQPVLAKESEQLRQQAVRLSEAAKTKNEKGANETLQQIHLTLKSLRPAE